MRFDLVRITIVAALCSGMLLSPELWMPVREFPLAPIFGFSLPSSLHFIFLGVAIALLIVSAIVRSQIVFCLFFIMMFPVLCADQFRWQPWVYSYLILLLPFCIFPVKDQAKVIWLQRLSIIALYFWSGIHKINPHFLEWISGEVQTQWQISFGYWVGILATVTEVILAIGLIFLRTRIATAFLLMAMHVTIIIYFGPANTVIIPWNIASMILLYLLFIGIEKENQKDSLFKAGMIPREAYFFLLLWSLPFLNFVGRWDHYLSFSLYSQKVPSFYAAVEESQAEKIEELKPYFVEIPGMRGGKLVDLNKWSLGKLNVPFYPESRVFRQVRSYFCGKAIPVEQLVFLEMKPNWSGEKEILTFYCD